MAMALIVSMLLFMLWVTLFSRFRLLVRGLFLQVNLAMFIFLPFHIILISKLFNQRLIVCSVFLKESLETFSIKDNMV